MLGSLKQINEIRVTKYIDGLLCSFENTYLVKALSKQLIFELKHNFLVICSKSLLLFTIKMNFLRHVVYAPN